MCHKYEFKIKLDGTLQFIKEKVVAESKVQKAAWDKHPSLTRKLTPIGEPSRKINVVESEPLLTESEEEGWKEADKIGEEHMKKEVMVLEREIKEWKKGMEVKVAEPELEKEGLEGGMVNWEEEGKGDVKKKEEEEGKGMEEERGEE